MIQSGDAAEQMVRLSLEGAEVAVRLTGTAAKEIALLLIAALKKPDKYLKTKGKARLTSMLKSGKALEIFSVRERDLAKFAQGAKQYGIVYCLLRKTKNSPDGLCDVLVKADDAPKISRLIERFQFATVDKAKIESEIVADRAWRTEDDRTWSSRTEGDMTGDNRTWETFETEPEGPDTHAAKVEKLLNELFGDKEGNAEPEPLPEFPEPAKPEPVKAGKELMDDFPFAITDPPPISPPSGPTSDSRKKSELLTTDKPSVKEELREISAALKQKEKDTSKDNARQTAGKPKSNSKSTHKQPPRGGRPKSKRSKSKGGR